MRALAVISILCAGALATDALATDSRRSSFDDMAPATQALQTDRARNPAMLWVKDGAEEWRRPAGEKQLSCATCHGDATTAMRGVAVRYPQYDATARRPLNLQQRINQCRTDRQQALRYSNDDDRLLGLEALVAFQSLGEPIAPVTDPRLASWRQRGEELYRQRFGQIDLSCADCHEANAGRKLAGNTIPQGHPTGYPIYRLEWQSLGSLQRRLRNCMVAVRAEPYATGSAEFAALEVFLAHRAAGMTSEAPAVRP
jgi:sulfur-oxidizing protein SoxA